MRVYPKNRYVKGTYKKECDVCGWDYLRSELRKRYDGLVVCKKCWLEKPTQEKGFIVPDRIKFERD